MRSYALAIVGAEYVLGWLPKGTHDWDKFVTPDELGRDVAAGGLRVTDLTGVVYNPLGDVWRAARDTGVNYMITAERQRAE
jgi:2-polyprenyl-6-hydroxyphenyl methylase/3-demethylubiquinone-9 3-methyltransferase